MNRFLGDRGFSIGVDDVTPSDRMTKIKNKLVIEGQRLADEEIQAYTSGACIKSLRKNEYCRRDDIRG